MRSALKILAIGMLLQGAPPPLDAQEPRRVAPVVEFPEQGLDDSAAYEGYRTRFFRDARGNVVQVYVDQRHGRVVNLLANAANESASFTVRDAAGRPALVHWASDHARVQTDRQLSTITYLLNAGAAPLEIGRFLLGSMRLERDFQYHEGHLRPFNAASIDQPELRELIANVERLPASERRAQLALLNAGSTGELRERLRPSISITRPDSVWQVRVSQTSFDGRNRLILRLRVDRRAADASLLADRVALRPRTSAPIVLEVRVSTDAAALTPLRQQQIFSADFLRFFERARAENDRLAALPETGRSPAERERLLRFRRLERQMRSTELMSYQEKLFAGLPNYATYFGRDMLMAALMMQSVWTPAMAEHVIASVLRKLTPSGEVSHEEALGGQAIRENAAEYNTHVGRYLAQRTDGQPPRADTSLARARALLRNLQAVRENYVMVDDDFQFPVLVARYLADPRVAPDRKRRFLNERARRADPESRLTLILRNLDYVARSSAPYAREAVASNLVSFPRRDTGSWFPGSWRDSNAGYAGGRFAMDINVIWVPAALRALQQTVSELRALGVEALPDRIPAGLEDSPLQRYMADSLSLAGAIRAWDDAGRHFWVTLAADEVRQRVQAKLNWLPEVERRYWEQVIAAHSLGTSGIRFQALSLDAAGVPIAVVNSDPATQLFLEGLRAPADRELADISPILVRFPVGLFIDGLGPLVANDAYASQEIWENFRRDHYHGPRVVWGREVNLLLLGLANQINDAFDSTGALRASELETYAQTLRSALEQTLAAVEQSGLKHTELWTYRVEDERLIPVRYPVSTDIQLWNLTDLAVQYELARMPAAVRTARIPTLF